MPSADQIFLSVLSDDFGMCEAVNEGIVEAFTKGLLTDANLMAPCPAFADAIQLAKTHKIPVGIHTTYTAEWDILRWGPLTPLKSMAQPDGSLFTTVEEAWRKADLGEAEMEFVAQWNAIQDAGLKITHACEHMGADAEGKMAGLYRKKLLEQKVPYRGFVMEGAKAGIPQFRWDSVFTSSGMALELAPVRKALKDWIQGLKPGNHLWHTHSASKHPSLDQMCTPQHHAIHWARTYRDIDQALLMDGEVRGWLEAKGVQRVPMDHCPVVGF